MSNYVTVHVDDDNIKVGNTEDTTKDTATTQRARLLVWLDIWTEQVEPFWFPHTWSKSCFPVVLGWKENSSSASMVVTRTLTCNQKKRGEVWDEHLKCGNVSLK